VRIDGSDKVGVHKLCFFVVQLWSVRIDGSDKVGVHKLCFFVVQLWSVRVDGSDKVGVDFLSTLSRHSRAVNIVRFSPDGPCCLLMPAIVLRLLCNMDTIF